MTKKPIISVKAWGIINTKDLPNCEPTYIRFGGENSSWYALGCEQFYGDSLDRQIQLWKDDGFRSIEVIIVPLENYIEIEK